MSSYTNKMFLIRCCNTTDQSQDIALISVNNRFTTTYFNTIAKVGSPIIYYRMVGNTTELYMQNSSDYPLFEIYLLSYTSNSVSIGVEPTDVDFSTLTSVSL